MTNPIIWRILEVVCWILLIIGLLTFQEEKLCRDWGGELYDNGRCELVADMNKCVQTDGKIREKTPFDDAYPLLQNISVNI